MVLVKSGKQTAPSRPMMLLPVLLFVVSVLVGPALSFTSHHGTIARFAMRTWKLTPAEPSLSLSPLSLLRLSSRSPSPQTAMHLFRRNDKIFDPDNDRIDDRTCDTDNQETMPFVIDRLIETPPVRVYAEIATMSVKVFFNDDDSAG